MEVLKQDHDLENTGLNQAESVDLIEVGDENKQIAELQLSKNNRNESNNFPNKMVQ